MIKRKKKIKKLYVALSSKKEKTNLYNNNNNNNNNNNMEDSFMIKNDNIYIDKKKMGDNNHSYRNVTLHKHDEKNNNINYNRFHPFNNVRCLKKENIKEHILMKEKKKFNICFLNLNKGNYQINYFSNIGIMKKFYKFCGKGLILVNVQYINNDTEKGKKENIHINNNIKNLNLKENVDVLNKRHKKNIIFQTDIYICSTYKGNKNIKKKKSRTIIFIIKVNVEELKIYLCRKKIFEEKYINNSFYIHTKVVQIIYFLTLQNCKIYSSHNNNNNNKTEILNVHNYNVNYNMDYSNIDEKSKQKLLKYYLSNDEYMFFQFLTSNLFEKNNRYKNIKPKEIYKNIVKIRNYIFNVKEDDKYEQYMNLLSTCEESNIEIFKDLYNQCRNNKYQSISFNIFFSLLSNYKKNILMLNVSTLRFLYSHMKSEHTNNTNQEKKSQKKKKSSKKKKKQKKNICCINKDDYIYNNIINKEQKKELNKYLILCADKCNIYLLKFKFTKITRNLFTTKFLPLSIQKIPKEEYETFKQAFATSRISLLKIIYERSCIILANQYRRKLTPMHISDKLNCHKKYIINNINYNLKRLLDGKSLEESKDNDFCIAGLDVIYVNKRDDTFELTVYVLLLSNIIFCYKVNFEYY
ncbi:hypothetical protein PFTANZ_05062 [Plasmodium falciparum Tanzania (2000708)]|uniref:Uncharacterized protein n=1 Tax=Plasmodium falciparum Tanzania (2000708) TaxID=1036725 RepID=A0A024W0M6_PLAFA|nr:hypothetical protein PFTANZ_05062 [Plasmodium falciparum Tanzania (2000708)]